MNTKTFSLCIYKEEFNDYQLSYIKENFIVIEEIKSRLIIRGCMEELDKVMLAAFETDERFKQIFPSYQTAEERNHEINELFNKLVEEVRDTLLQAVKLGCNRHNSEIYKLFAGFYFDKLMPFKNRK